MIITAIAIVKETFINAKSYVVLLWVVLYDENYKVTGLVLGKFQSMR